MEKKPGKLGLRTWTRLQELDSSQNGQSRQSGHISKLSALLHSSCLRGTRAGCRSHGGGDRPPSVPPLTLSLPTMAFARLSLSLKSSFGIHAKIIFELTFLSFSSIMK